MNIDRKTRWNLVREPLGIGQMQFIALVFRSIDGSRINIRVLAINSQIQRVMATTALEMRMEITYAKKLTLKNS